MNYKAQKSPQNPRPNYPKQDPSKKNPSEINPGYKKDDPNRKYGGGAEEEEE
jgi:hypothetical protein